jgi:competence protein ComEA
MEQAKPIAAAPPPSEPAVAEFGLLGTWPRCVQVAVGVSLALGVGFLLGRSHGVDAANHDPDAPSAAETTGPRLDLNRATQTELALLPGVGAARAQGIVDYRRLHGPFRRVDDLRNVAGIGPRTLDKIRPWLLIDPSTAASPPSDPPVPLPPAAPARAPAKAKKESRLTGPIDVNRADTAELQKLPGVGAKTAQRIIDERTLRGPFKTVDELRRVPGIGPKTLEKLRPYVIVESPAVSADREKSLIDHKPE